MARYRAEGRHLPYVQSHRKAHRDYMRKRRYGLTKERHAEMLAEQGGGCAICGRSDKRLVVDHGHRDMAVRGLLCDMCNHAIGYLENYIPSIGADKFTEYLAR